MDKWVPTEVGKLIIQLSDSLVVSESPCLSLPKAHLFYELAM